MATTGPGNPSTDEDDTPAEAPTEVRQSVWQAAGPEAATEAEEIAEAAEALSAAAEVADAAEVLAEAQSADADPVPAADATPPSTDEDDDPADPSFADRSAERLAAARVEAAETAEALKEAAAERAEVVKEAAKKHGGRARVKLGKAAADARDATASAAHEVREMAAKGASGARERAANTDMKEFAASTTSLIDTARPFFLAGCAAVFAILGFIEGDPGTAQIFAVGAVLCVVGAAFSSELNAMLHSRAERMAAKAEAEAPPRPPGPAD